VCYIFSKGVISLENDKPPEQPAPETVVVAATSTEKPMENDYYNTKKQSTTVEDLDNDKNNEDQLYVYESICEEAASPVETP